MEAGRWGPPPVDEDWHAVCQGTYKGVEGAEWETLYFKFLEINKAVNVRHPSVKSKTKTLWNARDAKERGDAYCDQPGSRRLRIGTEFGAGIVDKHQQNPVLTLDQELRSAEVWDDAGSSDGGREQNLNIFSY